MKNVQIWTLTNDAQVLIPSNEIEQAIYLGEEMTVILEGKKCDPNYIKFLDKKLKEFEESEEGEDFAGFELLDRFLDHMGIETDTTSETYYDRLDGIVFDSMNHEFYDPAQIEKTEIYTYWDGSNWQTIEAWEEVATTDLVISEEFVNLDEWDGRNMVTGGMGHHADVHRVLEMDGIKEDDLYLVWETSDWQGDNDTGQIMDINQLKQYLQEISRDVDFYIQEIKEIQK